MTKKILLVLVALAFVLGACSNSGKKKDSEDEMPVPIDVKLNVNETADVNEKVALLASVMQGDEEVADADEVMFEVWQEGSKDESEMIEATNHDDGTYEAEKAFDHDGVYTIQVHVTARGMHSMPKKSITIGQGVTESEDADHADHEHGDHEHGNADGVSMHFMKPETIKKGTETNFIVHLQDEDHPLEGADVRYEIWNDEISEKHDYIDAEEVSAGEYSATHTFTESGTYMVKIHVENDTGLHEHEEHEVEVK